MVVELPIQDGFIKTLAYERPAIVPVNCDNKATECSVARDMQPASQDETSAGPKSRSTKRYYIDELGFYRYLDQEQRQYVCSNVSMNSSSRKRSSQNVANGNGSRSTLFNNNNNNNNNNNKEDEENLERVPKFAASGGQNRAHNRMSSPREVGLEVCFKTVRRDLGISHFDKTEDYDNWKRGWDEFMRAKLTSQQPVTLNRELKNRVRSGIPHDYRCKVWSALIRMRTRAIRATFGEDIYDVIISDYVSKIGIPDYGSNEQRQQTSQRQDSNNNTTQRNGSETNEPRRPGTNQSRHDRAQQTARATPDPSGSSYIEPMTAPANLRARDGQHASQRMLAQEPQIDKCFKQIELDLLRTLPNNRHFENPNSIGIKRVRRVLRAYACFNQEVSYCQGMNRLAAMALLVLPEEEAFWCLVAIIQCIMPRDYYLKPWLAQVDCCVLGDLLEKKLPKLHKHLVSNDIQLTLFSWFFTIFIDGFRPELMLRIWDCFLLEGDKVLFRFALAILHITQDELLEMGDFSTMSSHLSRLVSTRALDVEQLFEAGNSLTNCSHLCTPNVKSVAFNTMNPLSTGSLQARREFHRRRMRAMLEE